MGVLSKGTIEKQFCKAPRDLYREGVMQSSYGLHEASVQRGLCKAPRDFMKPLHTGRFVKLLEFHEAAMQGLGLNLGHVIKFTFVTQEFWQDQQSES